MFNVSVSISLTNLYIDIRNAQVSDKKKYAGYYNFPVMHTTPDKFWYYSTLGTICIFEKRHDYPGAT